DKHNRFIYYNKSNSTGYIISNDYIDKFRILNCRYMLAIVFGAFIHLLFFPFYISLIIAIISALYLEYLFRYKVLYQLTTVPNFKVENSKSQIEILAEDDQGKLILKLILYIALAIGIMLNAFDQKFDVAMLIVSGIVSFGSLYISMLHILAIRFKKL
ncbi:MAG: hypothetical protein RR546_08075, partial [Erysipelotrichaceae bacterium]